MRNWQKLLVVIVPAVILIVIGFFIFHHRMRHSATAQTKLQKQQKSITAAQAKLPKKPVINSVKSAQQLAGKQVWVQDGYSFQYFPYRHHRVDYARPAGLLPGMQKLSIEKIVTARKPRHAKTQIPGGRQQVLAVFTMPDSHNTYALPIGYTSGKTSEFYCGQMFYYNNPHQLYSYWPKSAWSAIEKHQVVPGMTELQAEAALGVNQKKKAASHGDHIVIYTAGKKKWKVTFRGDKVIAVSHG